MQHFLDDETAVRAVQFIYKAFTSNKVGLREGFKCVKGTLLQINTDKIDVANNKLHFKIQKQSQ